MSKLIFTGITILSSFLALKICGFMVNTSASLPLGVYREAGSIERGGFALFCLEDEGFIKLAQERGYLGKGECPGGIKPLGKKIFGLAGDEISFPRGADGEIAVDGQIIERSSAKSEDSRHRGLPASHLTAGRIPEGFALMLSSHHAGGFDSRYFGLVKVSALTPVQPVFTWE